MIRIIANIVYSLGITGNALYYLVTQCSHNPKSYFGSVITLAFHIRRLNHVPKVM